MNIHLKYGRPPQKILWCRKHDIEKTHLNSRGARICLLCSRDARQKSYSKNLDHSRKLNALSRLRNKDYYLQYSKSPQAIQKSKEWIKENPQKYKEIRQKWCQKNVERTRSYCANRRALKKNAEGSHTIKEWLEVVAKQNNKCNACKKTKKLERDHIIALSKGGTNYIENIQALCKSCNTSKHNNDYQEWLSFHFKEKI